MKLKFTHVCLLCVAVLATDDEHEHEVEGGNGSSRAAKVGVNMIMLIDIWYVHWTVDNWTLSNVQVYFT